MFLLFTFILSSVFVFLEDFQKLPKRVKVEVRLRFWPHKCLLDKNWLTSIRTPNRVV